MKTFWIFKMPPKKGAGKKGKGKKNAADKPDYDGRDIEKDYELKEEFVQYLSLFSPLFIDFKGFPNRLERLTGELDEAKKRVSKL